MASRTLQFFESTPPAADTVTEILAGLRLDDKTISPKFFYDEEGSRLFSEITRQPEYYPTRTELGLLRQHADAINEKLGPDCLLIEFGSGSSEKIKILLEGLRPRIYAPLDISRDYLAEAAQSIAASYPWLEVRATCLDYTQDLSLPFELDARPVGFFPGSSIGNFEPVDALAFLASVRQLVGPDGTLLIGVDMKKDHGVLNAAYNDANGITRDFNLNILSHLNSVFGFDFDTGRFEHLAFYNEDKGCIQMFLRSAVDQAVTVAEEQIEFQAGELVHTENSFKYDVDEFLALAAEAGFPRHDLWQDENDWFGVFLLYGS